MITKSLLTVAALSASSLTNGSEGEEQPLLDFTAPQPAELETRATPPSDLDINWLWKNGLRFETEDGSVKGKLGGRLFLDLSTMSVDRGLSDNEGTEFRTARLFLEVALEEYFFKAEYDFAGGTDSPSSPSDKRPQFKDVYIGRKNIFGSSATAKVGHFKEPFGLEQLTSSKYITFMERSMNTEAFTPSRNNGLAFYDTFAGENATWAAGIFKQNTDDGAFSSGDGNFAVTARVTGTPVYQDDGETLVHLGAGYSIRDNDSVRFRSRPEIHISDRFVDTGTLMSDDLDLGNVELAGVYGPFHGSFEYEMATATGSSGMSDVDVSGYSFQLGYFCTGESRPYKRSAGTWDRVKPKTPYESGKGGLGAFETAVRFSSIDLDDGSVLGGQEDNITLAVNWYLTSHMRFGVNYIMGDVDMGASDADVDILGMRLQIDF